MKRDILIASTVIITSAIVGISYYLTSKNRPMQHKETKNDIVNYKSLHPYNHCLIVSFAEARKNGELLKMDQAKGACEKLINSKIKTEKE